MNLHNTLLTGLATLCLLAALPSQPIQAATPENCGVMYNSWGVDTQWEPYNQKAREARCARYGLTPAAGPAAVQVAAQSAVRPDVHSDVQPYILPPAKEAQCGKIYVWGREVQDQPYNQKASAARCAKGW